MRLQKLRWLRRFLVSAKRLWLVKIWGMDLHPTCQFSLSAKFDHTNPRGVHVGKEAYVAFDAAILTHDLTRGIRAHTRIERRCFIGGRSVVLPGVTIGEGSIVGAGSVVIRDVPPNSIVAGNPAKVIKSEIEVGPYGRLKGADKTQERMTIELGLD
jgi:acetyltransferase-like isoleucine patch superfamily enzyme